jgi:starch-binding outer membrane protein, SusD/RagB family
MKTIFKITLAALLLSVVSSCHIDEQINPNSSSLNSILENATKTDLNNLVNGALASMRTGYSTYVVDMGTIARELYYFDADPRNTTDLIGATDGGLDNNTFYTTTPWNRRYQTVKDLNILLQALPNANISVTEAEKKGYRAFANTLKAHQLLMLINMQDENGIRVDVADPENLGPIATKAETFASIATLLNTGYDELTGATFSFSLSSGFAGFSDPENFGKFNRALAARVALYRGLYTEALNDLEVSFLDLDGDLNTGVKMVYSTAGPDVLNTLYKTPDQSGDQIIVTNSFIGDAEAGDLRVSRKTGLRKNPTNKSGLNGTHETRLYPSNISPIDVIRNEELILIYAEGSIQNNQLASGVAGLDIIRQSAGLQPLATAKPAIINDKNALIDEMLHQRRYSFWGEAQRAIDLRRYDRLNETYVTIDPATSPDGEPIPQEIFTRFPLPATENQ